MHYCPEPNCEYRTPHSKNLRRHVEKTKHGKMPKGKRFRGHLATAPKRKKKGKEKAVGS